MRTKRAEEYEAGQGDDPEVHGVDSVATIELGDELALDIWISQRTIKN